MKARAVLKREKIPYLLPKLNLPEEDIPSRLPVQIQVDVHVEDGKLLPLNCSDALMGIDLTPFTEKLLIET